MRFLRGGMLVALAATLITAAPAWAGQTLLVGGDSGKTIAGGLAMLHPGDTLQILPGSYHEVINVPCDNVTIEGAGPGVKLEGASFVTVKDFTPAPERPGVFTWLLPSEAPTGISWVCYNGQQLVASKAAVNPSKQTWAFYIDEKAHRVEVVLGSKGFPATGTIMVPTIAVLVQGGKHNQLTVRGLELDHPQGSGISVGNECTVEDNLVQGSGFCGIDASAKSLVTRNTTRGCRGPGILLEGDAMQIEDNLMVGNGSINFDSWCASQAKMNALSYCTLQQNWLVDRPFGGLVKVEGETAMLDGTPVVKHNVSPAGLWPDIACYNDNFIDNAVARTSGAGIYIEATANRNVVMANDVQDCAAGITLRTSSQGLVTRNWVWDRECLGWGKENMEGFAGFGVGYDDAGTPISKPWYDYPRQPRLHWNDKKSHDNDWGNEMYGRQIQEGLSLWQTDVMNTDVDWCMDVTHDNVLSRNLVQVSGLAVSIPLWKRAWPSAAERRAQPTSPILSNQFTDNYYTLPAKNIAFAALGKTLAPTIDAYRQLSGWDLNAHVGNYTPAVLGLEPIWTIPGLANDTRTPVSILHDPSLETMSTLTPWEPMFWHGSLVRIWSTELPATLYESVVANAHSGRWYLSVTNTLDAQLDKPLGWYSSAIPVKPGITMGVNLWMTALHVKAAKPGTGARVSFRFTDATGYLVGESTVVGDGKYAPLLSGSYGWKNVDGQAVVPAGAYWMTVYLGDDPSTGTVRYDDIHINMRNPVPPHYSWMK